MRTQKVALNLTVVDFSTFVEEVEGHYYRFYIENHESLTSRDCDNLILYYTYKCIVDLLNSLEYKKDIIFYINTVSTPQNRVYKSFKKLQKVFPLITLENSLDFNNLETKTGESIELTVLIKNKRFTFDYSTYSRRKMQKFLEKYRIKLPFPT